MHILDYSIKKKSKACRLYIDIHRPIDYDYEYDYVIVILIVIV